MLADVGENPKVWPDATLILPAIEIPPVKLKLTALPAEVMIRFPLIINALAPVILLKPIDVAFISKFPYVLPESDGTELPANE